MKQQIRRLHLTKRGPETQRGGCFRGAHDITTHSSTGSIEANNLLKPKNIRYVESPVMGGPVQAEEGILGAIVGSNQNDFEEAKSILLNFCKEVIYFGKIGMGAKTKLLSNFLSLGTATFVIETLKAANHLKGSRAS